MRLLCFFFSIYLFITFPVCSWAREPEDRYDRLIMRKAKQYRLSPALLKALIRVESSFNPYAISPSAHAMGLTQIIPENFKRLGITNPFDPDQSITAGASLLASHTKQFRGSIRLSLIAYNAGERTAIREMQGQRSSLPAETRAYLKKIKYWYVFYRKQFLRSGL